MTHPGLSISEPDFVFQISQLYKSTRERYFIQNMPLDLSFRRIEGFDNLFLGSLDINPTAEGWGRKW